MHYTGKICLLSIGLCALIISSCKKVDNTNNSGVVQAQTYNINSFAGNGSLGFAGDGGSAYTAELNTPGGLAIYENNIYIADRLNNRIRRVNTNGIINTVAGNGTAGFYGDGGNATAAELNGPTDVAVDINGNIYIADCGNQRVRKVGSTGTISTLSGTGTAGYSGDNAAANLAMLNYPTGVTVDGNGEVFIADRNNQRVREVNTFNIITTIAGIGVGGFYGDGGDATAAELFYPTDLAIDGYGNIYIADYQNSRIRQVTNGGIISTYAGSGTAGYAGDGGTATAGQLWYPTGVAADGTGNIYIADENNQRIRLVNENSLLTTIAGNGIPGYTGDGGPASAAELYSPYGITVDALGNVYISDTYNFRIRKITPVP